MKQLLFGIGLLLLLLVGGLLSSFGVRWVQAPIASQLEEAAEAGFLENWAEAEARFAAARSRWKRYNSVLASIADHGPMEEIDCLFGELEFYIRSRDPVLFAGLCSRLSQLAQALGETHLLRWWNLL